MKSYIVFSDLHGCRGSYEKLKPLIEENSGAIFAGDGLNMAIECQDYAKEFYYVKGNCDSYPAENEMLIDVEGVKIFLTHGHLYGAKGGLYKMYLRAKELGAKVVIFGHTHSPLVKEFEDVLFINPGTCSSYAFNKTFAYLTLANGKAVAVINDTTLMG